MMEGLPGSRTAADQNQIKIFDQSDSMQIHVSESNQLEEGKIIDGPDGPMILIKIDDSNQLFAVPCDDNSEPTIKKKSYEDLQIPPETNGELSQINKLDQLMKSAYTDATPDDILEDILKLTEIQEEQRLISQTPYDFISTLPSYEQAFGHLSKFNQLPHPDFNSTDTIQPSVDFYSNELFSSDAMLESDRDQHSSIISYDPMLYESSQNIGGTGYQSGDNSSVMEMAKQKQEIDQKPIYLDFNMKEPIVIEPPPKKRKRQKLESTATVGAPVACVNNENNYKIIEFINENGQTVQATYIDASATENIQNGSNIEKYPLSLKEPEFPNIIPKFENLNESNSCENDKIVLSYALNGLDGNMIALKTVFDQLNHNKVQHILVCKAKATRKTIKKFTMLSSLLPLPPLPPPPLQIPFSPPPLPLPPSPLQLSLPPPSPQLPLSLSAPPPLPPSLPQPFIEVEQTIEQKLNSFDEMEITIPFLPTTNLPRSGRKQKLQKNILADQDCLFDTDQIELPEPKIDGSKLARRRKLFDIEKQEEEQVFESKYSLRSHLNDFKIDNLKATNQFQSENLNENRDSDSDDLAAEARAQLNNSSFKCAACFKVFISHRSLIKHGKHCEELLLKKAMAVNIVDQKYVQTNEISKVQTMKIDMKTETTKIKTEKIDLSPLNELTESIETQPALNDNKFIANMNNIEAETTKKSFICKICNKKYLKKHFYIMHLWKMHEIEMNPGNKCKMNLRQRNNNSTKSSNNNNNNNNNNGNRSAILDNTVAINRRRSSLRQKPLYKGNAK